MKKINLKIIKIYVSMDKCIDCAVCKKCKKKIYCFKCRKYYCQRETKDDEGYILYDEECYECVKCIICKKNYKENRFPKYNKHCGICFYNQSKL